MNEKVLTNLVMWIAIRSSGFGLLSLSGLWFLSVLSGKCLKKETL
jgi:hypothetical protein